jgi:hypothetical protein
MLRGRRAQKHESISPTTVRMEVVEHRVELPVITVAEASVLAKLTQAWGQASRSERRAFVEEAGIAVFHGPGGGRVGPRH